MSTLISPFTLSQGQGPLILAMPHGGTFVPPDIAVKLNKAGLALTDTDWHIERLYKGLLPGATTIAATFHRYVIDANRDPAGHSLYPGQNTTGLVPLTDFDGLSIWHEHPDEGDIQQRIAQFHRPYHAALAGEIARVKALHGFAIVYDCHSIRSHIPFLFDGTLPTLNIGTDNGATSAPAIERAAEALAAASGYSHVVNGRFRGGWTTRHYGRPHDHVHAIQMEIAQSAYLETEAPPFDFSPTKSALLRPVLAQILHAIIAEITPS
jgi:N-formylglutamate deformylase